MTELKTFLVTGEGYDYFTDDLEDARRRGGAIYVLLENPFEIDAAVKRVRKLFLQKLAAEYPDHPWLKKGER
jgi:hypothetical protein